MSGSASDVLRNGPESIHVVDAVDAVLRGDVAGARAGLDAGAEAASWAAVLHRLDVAGRALARDDEVAGVDAGLPAGLPDGTPGDRSGAHDPVSAAVVDLAGDALAAGAVLAAWAAGGGIAVAVDLLAGTIDLRSDAERAGVGLAVLALLVDRSGFPPQVVA